MIGRILKSVKALRLSLLAPKSSKALAGDTPPEASERGRTAALQAQSADSSKAFSSPAPSKPDHQVTPTRRSDSRHSHEASLYTAPTRHASLTPSLPPETAAPISSAPTEVGAGDLVAEKHIYVREVELSTSSSARLPGLPAASETATEPVSPSDSALSLLASPKLAPRSTLNEDAIEIMQRKIWVKRPGASATLVTVQDDALVDTVRDVILEKYRNSLGKSVDSPDISLRLVSREQGSKSLPLERTLGPDEHIGRLLDAQYPGGQTIDDALVIDIPQRRTPRPSPRVGNHQHALAYPYFVEDLRPGEGAPEYFPPMAVPSPHPSAHPHAPHSMAIVNTGQLPALPSPGGHSTRKHRDGRPKYVRQHTSSPTILHSSQAHSDELKPPVTNGIASNAPLATPPAPQEHRQGITPTNRPTSPHTGQRPKRKSKNQSQPQSANSITVEPPPPKLASAGLLDGKVPPINVLIVEDNPINMRLLEQFMKKLQVRWKTAVNGREAVNTWRTGGFHLVLMDIQLPVMSGLEATKEIRRLESANGIGLGLVGGQTANGKQKGDHDIPPEDKLGDISLFKSPVIIVALTASSLQSDRHEALAVGCNDFLTKPVGFPWMVRKVTEWGCMQALIDFDGWRQWKASAEKQDEGLTEEQKKARDKEEKAKKKAALTAMFSRPPPSTRAEKEEVKNEPGGKSPVNGTGPPRRVVRGSSGSGKLLETHHEESEE